METVPNTFSDRNRRKLEIKQKENCLEHSQKLWKLNNTLGTTNGSKKKSEKKWDMMIYLFSKPFFFFPFPIFLLSKRGLSNRIKLFSGGTWVVQFVKHLTLDFGSSHDLIVLGLEPHVGLSANSVEPVWDFLSLSPSLSLSLSLPSLSQENN